MDDSERITEENIRLVGELETRIRKETVADYIYRITPWDVAQVMVMMKDRLLKLGIDITMLTDVEIMEMVELVSEYLGGDVNPWRELIELAVVASLQKVEENESIFQGYLRP